MRALLVCLAFAACLAALAPATASAARTCKGTVKVTGKKTKIVVLRGVSCRKAKSVARKFRRPPVGWGCGGVHPDAKPVNGRRPLYVCGSGSSGDLTKSPKAFLITVRR